MKPLIRDAYIFFIEYNKQSLKKISEESLKVFMTAMMDNMSLSRCFIDDKYVEGILNRYSWYTLMCNQTRPDFRSKVNGKSDY